ncbi:MAG: hypothetical protein JNL38_24245 [Myxococcales bacterium]|jgi:hypothetical protein|nr:hypothetical protein [Myxococcales bacterium]
MHTAVTDIALRELVVEIQDRDGPWSPELEGPLLALAVFAAREGSAVRAGALLRRVIALRTAQDWRAAAPARPRVRVHELDE